MPWWWLLACAPDPREPILDAVCAAHEGSEPCVVDRVSRTDGSGAPPETADEPFYVETHRGEDRAWWLHPKGGPPRQLFQTRDAQTTARLSGPEAFTVEFNPTGAHEGRFLATWSLDDPAWTEASVERVFRQTGLKVGFVADTVGVRTWAVSSDFGRIEAPSALWGGPGAACAWPLQTLGTPPKIKENPWVGSGGDGLDLWLPRGTSLRVWVTPEAAGSDEDLFVALAIGEDAVVGGTWAQKWVGESLPEARIGPSGDHLAGHLALTPDDRLQGFRIEAEFAGAMFVWPHTRKGIALPVADAASLGRRCDGPMVRPIAGKFTK